jgi:hypothetical protein
MTASYQLWLCNVIDKLDSTDFFRSLYQALAMLARLFRYGRLSYHGGFVNLQTGRAAPIPVNPTGWKRMKNSCTRLNSI